ncbi:hypothetical protein [Streptomyces sp. NPDC047841]|uniref:hypothetical protein n=1 Tax=Streptomyces sp. NPDC047841 TaxID=3154708 RepID=UPI00345280A2
MHPQSDTEQAAVVEKIDVNHLAPVKQGDANHVVVVKVPKLPTIPTLTAVGSGGGLTAAIATGHVQTGVVWPAVVLAVAGMAYDVSLRLISRLKQA